MKQGEKKVYFYNTLQDDFVESANQKIELPADYVWVKPDLFSRMAHSVLYYASWIFAWIFGRSVLHVRIVRNADVRKYRDTGAVIYCNHTQPLGDVFMPALVCGRKQCFIVASTPNLGIAFFGKWLPYMGALPIPDSMKDMPKFLNAVRERIQEKKCIIIYPEAHVWPYYIGIRPFPVTSFSFAVNNHVPAFSSTVTYQPRKRGRPKTTIYVDGPFYADPDLPEHQQRIQLHDLVYAQMQKRSRRSTCRFIEYRQKASPTDEDQD